MPYNLGLVWDASSWGKGGLGQSNFWAWWWDAIELGEKEGLGQSNVGPGVE